MRFSALIFVSLFAAACYSPAPANGAWTCSEGTHDCPSGYYCAADDTCWNNDTLGSDGGMKTDAGADGGMDGGPGCTGVYCFTFENDDGDKSSMLELPQGCDVVDDGTAHSGARYGSCSATNVATQMILPVELGADQPVIGFRAWLRIKPSGTLQFANLCGLSTSTSWMLVGSDGSSALDVNYTNSTTTTDIDTGFSADTAGAWRCVEMVATRPNGLVFYVDAQQAGQASDFDIPASFTQILLGIAHPSDNDARIEVDLDDVVVGYQRIGCD